MDPAATLNDQELVDALPAARPRWWNGLRRHRSAQIGGSLILVFLLGVSVGAFLLRDSPSAQFGYQDLAAAFQPPSLAHPLGTDWVGRDVLVRLIYGARYTLAISTAAVLAGLVVGDPHRRGLRLLRRQVRLPGPARGRHRAGLPWLPPRAGAAGSDGDRSLQHYPGRRHHRLSAGREAAAAPRR